MAEAQAASPANSDTKIDVAAIVKTATEEVGKQFKSVLDGLSGQVAELSKNQKVLADTFAAEKEALKAASKTTDTAAKSLTADDVLKLLDERDSKRQETAEQKAKREAFIADPNNGLANFVKVPIGKSLVDAKIGADPSKWADEAKAIVAQVESSGIKMPDVGGAGRDGGKTPADGGAAVPKFANLTEGQRKFAEGLKMPGQTTAA